MEQSSMNTAELQTKLAQEQMQLEAELALLTERKTQGHLVLATLEEIKENETYTNLRLNQRIDNVELCLQQLDKLNEQKLLKLEELLAKKAN